MQLLIYLGLFLRNYYSFIDFFKYASPEGEFFFAFFRLNSNNKVFYSCLDGVGSFLRTISLLKIIIEEAITKIAPTKVFTDGTSPQIKYPNTIAKTKAKYFKGVTSETSEYL